MYSLPQEIEVWYILPAIRREIATFLIKKHKLTYEKTGAILGISKAAVSQYISKKRANNFKIPLSVVKEIEESSDIIVKDNKKALSEIGRILKLLKETKCSCGVCKKYNPGIIGICGCSSPCLAK